MATEYLECRRCKKKVGGWSQGIIRQLSPTYSCQFPAVLTYNASRLCNTLREAHSDAWMRRAIAYLGVCEQFLALCAVTKKLAGTAADTAAWVTNVGNEHGQEWGQLVVRLDIWHLMRRFASGVTTETHELYAPFMRQLSHCIFEVDSGDARRLTEAKRSQLEGQHGMVGLTDAEVVRRISREEWRLHCRRRTRGAEESTLLIQDLLETFSGQAGRNILDIPLDPDTPDEAAAIESLGEDEDEGIGEEVEDPTVFEPDALSGNTPSRTELGPCKLAQRQSPGRGHLQPALPAPPHPKGTWSGGIRRDRFSWRQKEEEKAVLLQASSSHPVSSHPVIRSPVIRSPVIRSPVLRSPVIQSSSLQSSRFKSSSLLKLDKT
ncbi:hypothetical protein FQN60_007278 [Etheostoma spectabile]|uniref:DUF6729 domain-containing protein n=1 Tax=Etheostoma spectabile TaxID=54343 RepID=A0A5J5CAI3_9PERO|nr:hypothetical protein FQN60_007278 [Etheostoma spectabile]